jgi:hypothetical protein
MLKLKTAVLAVATAMILMTQWDAAQAGTVAYQVHFGTAGNQAFDGAYEMDFDVNSPIEVTKLGVFDSGSDGLGLPITAQRWSRSGISGSLLASLAFSPDDPGTLVNGSRFMTLPSSMTLPVGSYTIAAHGYGGAEPAFNQGVSLTRFAVSRTVCNRTSRLWGRADSV